MKAPESFETSGNYSPKRHSPKPKDSRFNSEIWSHRNVRQDSLTVVYSMAIICHSSYTKWKQPPLQRITCHDPSGSIKLLQWFRANRGVNKAGDFQGCENLYSDLTDYENLQCGTFLLKIADKYALTICWLFNNLYRKSISLLPWARQLYRMENLYLLEHPVNSDVLRCNERRLKAIFLMHMSLVNVKDLSLRYKQCASEILKIKYQNSVLSTQL